MLRRAHLRCPGNTAQRPDGHLEHPEQQRERHARDVEERRARAERGQGERCHLVDNVVERGQTRVPAAAARAATAPRVAAFRALPNRAGPAVAELTDFFERYDKEKYGSEGAPLHDPTVIAYLLDPTLFETRHINVTVETKSDLTLGATVADWWRVTDRKPNATWVRNLDADGFFKLLTDRLATLP